MEAPSSEKPRKCKCRQTANILRKSGQLCCNRSRERNTPGFQIHLQMLEMGVEGPRASTAPRRARGARPTSSGRPSRRLDLRSCREAGPHRLIGFTFGEIILTVSPGLPFPSSPGSAGDCTGLSDVSPGGLTPITSVSIREPGGFVLARRSPACPEAGDLVAVGLGSYQKPLKMIWFQVTATPPPCGSLPVPQAAALRLGAGGGEKPGGENTECRSPDWW